MDQKEPKNVSQQSTDLESPSNGVYHIYHTGKGGQSYSVHIVSDSNAALKLETNATGPQNHAAKNPSPATEPVLRRQSTLSTRIKRSKAYDDPRYDPRTESSPYFIHLPTLAFHLPPCTLRHGGNKKAPVAALMHPAFGWRRWKLEFGDVLSQDGVIDGRGAVSLKYGTTKGQEGTLKGYGVRSFRYLGESGKAWFREQKALGQQPPQNSMKAKPEEVVNLKWVSPFTFRVREYHFNWRGFKFIWKGTGKAQAKMIFRPLLRFNHLKLVVLLPDEDEKKTGATEVNLARYTSVMGARKMGRLELDQAAIDAFLVKHMTDIDQADPCPQVHENEKSSLADHSVQSALEQVLSRVHQRMDDVIIATGMSMIIGEYQKRQVIISIILAAIDSAPN